MHVKSGDTVVVISGKDKGKTGVVEKAFPKLNKVVVEGVNIVKRHHKPRKQGEAGTIVEVSSPLDASNVRKID